MTLNFSTSSEETVQMFRTMTAAIVAVMLSMLLYVAVYKPTALDKVIQVGTVLKEVITTTNGK